MDDRGPAVLAVIVALFAVASSFVILRFISKIVIVRRLGLHDYFMLLAWVIAFGFCFSICFGTRKGLGLHERDVPSGSRLQLAQAIYAFSVLYNPALMATKTSILVFYLTLMARDKIFRWANYATLLVVNIAGLALTLLNVFRCTPISAAFAYPIPRHSNCIDIITLYLSSAPVNIITDLIIFFLPMPVLTRMQLPLKQKIILIVTFSFGAFVAAVDVVRIAYLQDASVAKFQATTQPGSSGGDKVAEDDFSWYAALSFMWSAVEVNVGIICACVPSLKPLVARVVPKMIRDTEDNSHSENSQGGSNLAPPNGWDRSQDYNSLQTLQSVPNGKHRQEGPSERNRMSAQSNGGRSVSLVEFLTNPSTGLRSTSNNNERSKKKIPFFDFVKVGKPKSMLTMNNKESIPVIAIVTVLFFLWGFAYGLLDILNSQFQVLVEMSNVELMGLHAAYFGGYIIGPACARPILKHWGFRTTFVIGLCVYACGVLVFWPSAVLASFVAFLMSNLIVGSGLAVVETAANPFIALCGPMEYSEIRLNISQGVQAIGVVVSPILAKKALFTHATDAASLIDVQWTYLGIAFFDVLLAVLFYYLPIPEAPDEELAELANRRRSVNHAKIGRFRIVWVTLTLGFLSQYLYLAGQEATNMNFRALVQFLKPNSPVSSFDLQAVGHTLFAVGRFTTAFAQRVAKPRWILLFLSIGMVVTTALAMSLKGSAAVAMALLMYLFESGAFSLIFAISLRGMGEHTKTAGALMTAGISGGAFFPFILIPATDSRGIQYSLVVQLSVFAASCVFPLYLNLVPAARRQVDPVPDEYLKNSRRNKARHRGSGVAANVDESPLPSASTLPPYGAPEPPDIVPGESGIMHDLALWPPDPRNSGVG